MLAKANELVILTNDLRSTFGEVEREGRLVSTKIVYVEDELLWEIFWCPPDHPAYTRVYLSLSADANCDHVFQNTH